MPLCDVMVMSLLYHDPIAFICGILVYTPSSLIISIACHKDMILVLRDLICLICFMIRVSADLAHLVGNILVPFMCSWTHVCGCVWMCV